MAKKPQVDPRILALCQQVTAKRARTVIDLILAKGSVTTEELKAAGYDHPPRAPRDVREQGIPLVTTMIRSPEGRRMAQYSFGDPADIQAGRIGGRKAFPKRLKQQLLARDGNIDMFTGQHLPETALTIDHRIPYEVAGDIGDDFSPSEFMLLDGSSQRSKSWSCENCSNWQTTKDPEVCRSCYWAFPEDYSHMALLQLRRVDVSWSGNDVLEHDTLRDHARRSGVSVQELVRRAVRELLQRLKAT